MGKQTLSLVLTVTLALTIFICDASAGGRWAKLETALIEVMEAKDPDEPIRVALWLIPSRDPGPISKQMRENAGKPQEAELQAESRLLIEETQAPIIDFLETRGDEPIYASEYAPLLFAELSRTTILELAQRPEVDMVYLSRDYEPEINHAAKTERADVVWARGVAGEGVRIAVVESGRIEFGSPYLAAGATHIPEGAVSNHTTAVAGVIVANGGTPSDRWKGIAWGAPALLSANSAGAADAPRVAATDWAISNDAQVLNLSVGKDTDLGLVAMDRYLDYVVRHNYRTVVKSAGNEGDGTGNVTSPGLAYNVISVGSFDDKETFSWTGDEMWAGSSWKDPRCVITNILHNGNSTGLTRTVLTDINADFGPADGLKDKYLNPNTNQRTSFLITGNTATTITVSDMDGWYGLTDWAAVGDPYQTQEETSGDREKPEVVAVGTNIHSTVPAGSVELCGSGTSYAAPAVSGVAALIIARDNQLGGDLSVWPEAIKAIIMASACHDIETGSMEKDGAGAIVACEADEIVKNRQFDKGFLGLSDFDGGYWGKGIDLQAGRKTRVVLCWLSNPTRNLKTGTSTALSHTTLTDNTADFGVENSKVGWILNPNTDQDTTYYSVVGNTSTQLTVNVTRPVDQVDRVADVGDPYRLVSHPQDDLDANLDVKVWDPGAGSFVGTSESQYNNYELVDFTPSRTGTHEVRVYNTRFDGATEMYGLAWTQEPCCSPDWGDAPDGMLACDPPNKGDFPTLEGSNGARATEFEVEWLSKDNTTSPGATWEMDADVAPHQAEKDEDGVSNIRPPLCLADKDKEDDGVELGSVLEAGKKARVSFWVNSATPNIGRYSDTETDEKIYVSGWIDWEHDNTSWVGNDVVQWQGGPGMTGVMNLGTCIEGCDMWAAGQHQKRVVAEFDVPATTVAGPLWSRFRLSYGEPVTTVTDSTTYGEVEDYVLTVPIKVIERKKIHQGSYEGGAQGLYVRVWQKEDDIEIMDWDVEVSPDACVETGRAFQPDPSHSQRETTDGSPGDPDNGMHAVGINIWFDESVDYCEYITIDVTLWLTAWNTVREAEIEWWNFPE
jgi:hypothetical protein